MGSRWWRSPVAATCALSLLALPAPARAERAGTGIERISVSGSGVPGDVPSGSPSISAAGQFVSFSSGAGNLVPHDTNNHDDVFVRDRSAGTTEKPVVDFDGADPLESAWESSISGDGRYVAFSSDNSRLVPGDTNAESDIFVRDRWTGTTTRASVTSIGAETDDASWTPGISADGRFVAFASLARNLLAVDANGRRSADIFVHDLRLGTTTLVSESLTGTGGNRGHSRPIVGDDGRYVAFKSASTNLVADGSREFGVFVRDMWTGATTRESLTSAGLPVAGGGDVAMSHDGRFIGFDSGSDVIVPGDTNGLRDAFVRDRVTGTVEVISVATGGAQGDNASQEPSVSADGRCVAFSSTAANLVPGDGNGVTDVFVRDRLAGTTTRLSLSSSGGDPDQHSYLPAISADGRQVAFESWAANLLLPPDPDHNGDVFARDTGCG